MIMFFGRCLSGARKPSFVDREVHVPLPPHPHRLGHHWRRKRARQGDHKAEPYKELLNRAAVLKDGQHAEAKSPFAEDAQHGADVDIHVLLPFDPWQVRALFRARSLCYVI